MRRVELDPDIGGSGQRHEPVHAGRVEDQVLRMELEGDLHVMVAGQAVGLAPEIGGDPPLVVEHVQRRGIPGIDDPVRPGRPGLCAGQARHGHQPVLAQALSQPDRTANVLGLLLADDPVGVERVPVGVEAGDGHARPLEDAEEVNLHS
jgi:hypothetical protein